jgi:hypothetical protein
MYLFEAENEQDVAVLNPYKLIKIFYNGIIFETFNKQFTFYLQYFVFV